VAVDAWVACRACTCEIQDLPADTAEHTQRTGRKNPVVCTDQVIRKKDEEIQLRVAGK
jgi:hypothetical protein